MEDELIRRERVSQRRTPTTRRGMSDIVDVCDQLARDIAGVVSAGGVATVVLVKNGKVESVDYEPDRLAVEPAGAGELAITITTMQAPPAPES